MNLHPSQDCFLRPEKRRKIPKFLKRRTSPSFYGVIQIISPDGGLKESKENPEIFVGALLCMIFFGKSCSEILRSEVPNEFEQNAGLFLERKNEGKF